MMGVLAVLVLCALVVFGLLALVVKNLLYVAEPNEALVFSGARRVVDGREVGFRIVRGGRSVRIPLLEKVHRLDLSVFTIDVSVHNAYSRGGIPLSIVGVANVKIAGEEPLLNNAVERFLTRKSDEVLRIARETLEGNLRGVLATLTPEEVNEDKTRFAENLIDEAEHDMRRMGLVLETLKIQNVSDEVGYLNSIGRIRGASVRQEAAIAEAVAQADAAVKRANTQAAAELARIDAELEIMRAKFLKRTADAQTKRAAVIAEAEGQVGAEVAQLRAELELQRARVVQTQRQLEADVVQPAQAACAAAEQVARGEAARVVEAGRAQAAALGAIVARYQADAHSTRDILVFQKLLPLIGAVAGATRPVSLEKLTVLPRVADGQAPDFSRQAVRTAEELRAATGIDLASIARRLAGGAPGGGT